MSFEEFSIVLHPLPSSPFRQGNDTASVADVVSAIQAQWPDFQPDDVESARLREPLPNGVVILASETVAGLMQLIVQLGHTNCDDIAVWLRFAYCNPVSVFEPFCAVAAWLMRTYRLACHIEANPAPDSGGLRDVADADAVRAVLLSSMEYNRRLWQMDADTEETAILRPGDAVARFIAPQFVRK